MEFPQKLTSAPNVVNRLLLAYINDDVLLSKSEKEVYERLLAADEAVKDIRYSSNEKRAKALSLKFGVSIRTARNDLRSAMEFFNTADVIDIKTGARILLSQIDKLTSIILHGEEDGDTIHIDSKLIKGVIDLLKLKKEIYTDMIGAGVLDPKLLQQNCYTFNFGKEGAERLKLEKGASRKETLDLLRQYGLTQKQEENILKDADFEEIEDTTNDNA